MGVGLTNKTLGLIGFGGIGREFVKISKDLFKKVICFDLCRQRSDEKFESRQGRFYEIAKLSDFSYLM